MPSGKSLTHSGVTFADVSDLGLIQELLFFFPHFATEVVTPDQAELDQAEDHFPDMISHTVDTAFGVDCHPSCAVAAWYLRLIASCAASATASMKFQGWRRMIAVSSESESIAAASGHTQ